MVHTLADAFHCLPSVMFSSAFSWSYLLVFLADLNGANPESGRKYLAAFDKIVGFVDQ